MLDITMPIIQLLAGPLGGTAAGWMLVNHFSKEAEKKDTSHMRAVEQHIVTLQQEAASCASRYDILLREVLDVKSKNS